MEQPSDAEMHAALSLGPATRLAVIDAFVHRDGTLYLGADPAVIRPPGTVEATHLRTVTSSSGARVLAVHASPTDVALRQATDVPVPHSYEDVLNAALLAEGDGLMLSSGGSWIILAKSEVQSALTRRRRLASKAAKKARGEAAQTPDGSDAPPRP